eukprot:scaffold897_cov402-Prasinococcus_capsulatus_cf.AAC.76
MGGGGARRPKAGGGLEAFCGSASAGAEICGQWGVGRKGGQSGPKRTRMGPVGGARDPAAGSRAAEGAGRWMGMG